MTTDTPPTDHAGQPTEPVEPTDDHLDAEQVRAWLAGADERRASQPHPQPDSRETLQRRLHDLQSSHPDTEKAEHGRN